MTQAADSPNRTNAASGLRFLTELIGWTATPWALHRVDWAVAITALVLLIGLPAVVGTPGDRPFDPPVAIPGAAMLLLVLLEVSADGWPRGSCGPRGRRSSRPRWPRRRSCSNSLAGVGCCATESQLDTHPS